MFAAEDYRPPLTVVIANITETLTTALRVGPNQTVTLGPNEPDTSRVGGTVVPSLVRMCRRAVKASPVRTARALTRRLKEGFAVFWTPTPRPVPRQPIVDSRTRTDRVQLRGSQPR